MNVRVELGGQLRAVAGTASLNLDLPEGSRVGDAVEAVARQMPKSAPFLLDAAGRPCSATVLAVDGAQVYLTDPGTLQEGAVVSILSPIAGG